MDKRAALKRIDATLKNVRAEITANANHGGLFAGALAGEGYAGGYRDALHDVKALLTHGCVSEDSRFMRPPHE